RQYVAHLHQGHAFGRQAQPERGDQRTRSRRQQGHQALRSKRGSDGAPSLSSGVRVTMNISLASRRRQGGAYLLEALIGILIFGLGILGIVGLQAASLRTTADSALRAEAIFAANQLLGQMWTDDEANLDVYSSTIAGQPYKDFAAQLKAAQGGAWVQDPT